VQPVPQRDQPLPVLLQLGDRPEGVWSVEGTLAVTLGRYLHVHAQLWRAVVRPTTDINEWVDPRPPTVDTGAPSPAFDPADTPVPEALPPAFDPGPEAQTYQVLDEQRRMRSGELHYLDHPAFGVLIRIDAVTPPPGLTEAAAAIGADNAPD
jgi:hypothetical protein